MVSKKLCGCCGLMLISNRHYWHKAPFAARADLSKHDNIQQQRGTTSTEIITRYSCTLPIYCDQHYNGVVVVENAIIAEWLIEVYSGWQQQKAEDKFDSSYEGVEIGRHLQTLELEIATKRDELEKEPQRSSEDAAANCQYL